MIYRDDLDEEKDLSADVLEVADEDDDESLPPEGEGDSEGERE
ncbi:MAG: hypothetical protein UY63_C0004G0003 [Parcubacteria group bacterium GW2011_GWA2_51_10]|nr:MAG: hypothetical protein UY63_C0004G0003 [Parcubacteria group bacterium GW2011_GWA2_51_10]